MEGLLIAARTLHFAAVISLTGVFAFECLVVDPVFCRCSFGAANETALHRRLRCLAWASLALAVLAGAAWLLAVSSEMSGKPLSVAWSQGAAIIVLTRTRFGEDWLLRLSFALLCALCLVAGRFRRERNRRAIDWAALALAALMLVGLAWAGHGGATPGPPGDLHLAADILHLLAAGLWLGMLAPLALLLAEARWTRDARWATVARLVTLRFSAFAIAGVAVLLGSGLVNTWFLAGTVPALVGTEYGRLLLGKITLFLVVLAIAAVNLLRLTPRLAGAADILRLALGQLRRNAFLEATIGLGVLALVAALGVLPPGLHTQPQWLFPFRIDTGALSVGSQILLAILLAGVCVGLASATAVAAAGRYRRIPPLLAGVLLCAAIGWIALRPAIEPAYPTSFYTPAESFAAASVARGAMLYAENCAVCHGTTGRGDGPAAASLPVRPANLTEPHLFAHSPGDLFWWVSRGRDNGVMPGFAEILHPGQRWDVINFIRARAAGVLAAGIGPEVNTSAALEVPDFSFEADGAQQTLGQVLQKGPVLLMLFAPPAPVTRLLELAAAQRRFTAAGLSIIAVSIGPPVRNPAESEAPLPFVVEVSADVTSTLALYGPPKDRGETELMLDRARNVRARWTHGGRLPDAETLIADAERVASLAVTPQSHVGHVH